MRATTDAVQHANEAADRLEAPGAGSEAEGTRGAGSEGTRGAGTEAGSSPPDGGGVKGVQDSNPGQVRFAQAARLRAHAGAVERDSESFARAFGEAAKMSDERAKRRVRSVGVEEGRDGEGGEEDSEDEKEKIEKEEEEEGAGRRGGERERGENAAALAASEQASYSC
ncbi:hypothetical protein T492DRAFT_1090782 [Pavlovales sp. CCMP2436]|nr:hypothetical protein T492DRAFT_1090782 [Pavlovales sp. CCMP2436]